MAFARYERAITDNRGNLLTGVTVEVRREQVGQPLAALFADREGSTPLTNPFVTGVDGLAAFHVRGGAFQIVLTKAPSYSKTLRYVGIALGSESDDSLNITPIGAYDNGFQYLANDVVTDQGGSWIALQSTLGNAPPTLPTASNAYWMLLASPGAAGAGVSGNALELLEIATPATPAASTHKIYWKPDGQLYSLDSSGTERLIGGGTQQETFKAAEWMPTLTNGAGRSYGELASNDISNETLDFDTTTQEFACIDWYPPQKWNAGTITFQVFWRCTGGSAAQTIEMALSAVAISNDDVEDATFGTPVVVTDTFIANGDLHITSVSSAVTIGGTPAKGDKIVFKLQRNPANDNLGGDVQVEAVKIFWTPDVAYN